MAAREMIEIILKAEDQASQVFKQNEENVKRFGDAAKQASQTARNASEGYNKQLQETSKKIDKTVADVNKIGNEGSKSFKELSKSQQDAVTKFNMLDKSTQTTLQAIREVGIESRNMFPDGDKAVSSFSQLDNITKSWSGSLDYAKTKMQLLGNNTNTLKGKIQTTGMAIQTYLGTKWDSIKPKISGVSQEIRGKIGSAIDSVKAKLGGLGGGFNKLNTGAKSASQGLGLLRGAASMAAGMIGFELFNNMVQAGRASLNAASQLDYFAGRLKMNSSQISTFKSDLNELQGEFRKVDMTAVGASAEELAVKLKLPVDSLKGLSETIAVTSSAFVKEGRTQEDAILAVSDALDGQWAKLKELGITQEDLKNNGWNGDLNDKKSLLEGLNNTLGEMGFTDTAKDITTLDEAFSALSVIGGQLLRDVLVPITPTLISIVEGAITATDGIRGFVSIVQSAWNGLPDWAQISLAVTGLGIAFAVVGTIIMSTYVPGMVASMISTMNWIATALGAQVSAITLSGAFTVLAGAVWSALAPLLPFIAAAVLLAVAVFEVGKSFGWWHDIGSMIDAITSNIGRLWNAFINHPDVQAAISIISKALGDLINWVGNAGREVLKFFGISTGSNWDVVRSIIDGIGAAWNGLKSVVGTVIGIFQAIYNAALPIGQGIYNALKPIVCILLGCSPGIVPALQKVQEVFSTVWNAIAGFIGGVITTIVTAIQPIIDILSTIVNFYLSSFIYAWQTLIMVFNIVSTALAVLINTFTLFLNGQISLQTMLTMIWTTLSQMFALVLTTIINRVRSWAANILAKAISAGRGFVSGVIRFVSGLPSSFASYLIDIIGRIASAGASWISTAISKASEMVSGVINNVSQLPEKVYTEFMNIGSRIMDAGSELVQKATEIGQNIVNGLLNAMGIHSPGIIQESVVTEFVNMITRIGDKIKSAYDTAKTMGEAIVEGFGNPTLETDTSNILPNEDALKTSIGVQSELSHPMENTPNVTPTIDNSAVDEGNANVISSYDNLALLTGNALQQMIMKDQLAYQTIRNNDTAQLSAITANLQNKMSIMTNNVRTSMNTMVAKNKSGLTSAKNTTNAQLNSMVAKTKSANSIMIKSWGIMKDGIISAANKIRSDSTKHFDDLSRTIGSFYNKLRNPSQWGAGGPSSGKPHTIPRLTRKSGNGFNKITNAIQNANLPKYMSLSQVRNNPLIENGNFGDYITRDRRNNKFNVAELLKYGVIQVIGKGAGAYDDIPFPNIKLIKDTSNEWDMKGPLVGRYQTNKGFKVKDFLNGVPNISFSEFQGIAEDVFGQTDYEFYYDDDHHGNWLNAFNAGSMNCKHGAEALIALASVFGFSGEMVHGHWNQFGHYWANIAGHKMDVTGWQQRRTWTPSASAGPAPKSLGFKDLIEVLKDLLSDDPKPNGDSMSNNSEGKTISGEFTITHEFKNLPDHVSAEDVARYVEKSATNENILKKIAQHPAFQRYDLKEKLRLEKKSNRAKGV